MKIFLRLLLFISLCLVSFGAASANFVYVYDDLGACEECVQETMWSLVSELDNSYTVLRINAQKIISREWIKTAALLVIPGGRARFYSQLLNGDGNAAIKNFVENGGAFLGLCAGGYFSGAAIEFAKASRNEIVCECELGFFPGTVVGPALASYDYFSESGARIARVQWQDSSSHCSARLYYNGGGYFQSPERYDNTEVLARFEDLAINNAAIIKVAVNTGVAILTGVHIEYDTKVFSRIDPKETRNLNDEINRKLLFRHVLINLSLNLRDY